MEVKQLVEDLLIATMKTGGSDLTIFPTGKSYEVAIREPLGKKILKRFNREEAERIILFFKFKGGMDVAEKRKPQLGAADFLLNGQKIRTRLSTVSDYNQRESLVVRMMYGIACQEHLLFFKKEDGMCLKKHCEKRGLYLFCGPVNSGKTSMMYFLAKELSQQRHYQVITVEDPIEIIEESFLQLQINPKISVTYNELVKLSLRHRPDLLIVGEVRDEETAAAVIRAALTGHTIYSTIHAGSKEEVIFRLEELGIKRNEIFQALQGIIFQRLLPCVEGSKMYTVEGMVNQVGKAGVLLDSWFQSSGEALRDDWTFEMDEVYKRGQINEETYFKEK